MNESRVREKERKREREKEKERERMLTHSGVGSDHSEGPCRSYLQLGTRPFAHLHQHRQDSTIKYLWFK
jgi:hypothetical protein